MVKTKNILACSIFYPNYFKLTRRVCFECWKGNCMRTAMTLITQLSIDRFYISYVFSTEQMLLSIAMRP